VVNEAVKPSYLDVSLKAGDEFEQTLAKTDNTFIYSIEGQITIGKDATRIEAGKLAILSLGEKVIINTEVDSRFLLVSGQPIGEPVARGGPFVMNTKAEVMQAFADFQANRF